LNPRINKRLDLNEASSSFQRKSGKAIKIRGSQPFPKKEGKAKAYIAPAMSVIRKERMIFFIP
jgi:hypothetical protein